MPDGGLWKRAWRRADRFLVGAATFAVALSLAFIYLPEPDNPTRGQRVTHDLLGIGIAIAAVIIVTVAYSIATTWREQRDEALAERDKARDARDEARGEIASLRAGVERGLIAVEWSCGRAYAGHDDSGPVTALFPELRLRSRAPVDLEWAFVESRVTVAGSEMPAVPLPATNVATPGSPLYYRMTVATGHGLPNGPIRMSIDYVLRYGSRRLGEWYEIHHGIVFDSVAGASGTSGLVVLSESIRNEPSSPLP